MECGEKIAALRKKQGMTQAELGAKLNVTFQAVSKWERGESYPDFDTMIKIASIFGVKAEYFADETASVVVEEEKDEQPAEKKMLGVCKDCGKVLYVGDEGMVSPVLACKACASVRRQKAQAERIKAEEARKEREIKRNQVTHKLKVKRGWGYAVGALVATLFGVLFGVFVGPYLHIGIVIGTIIGGAIFLFTFLSQLIWGGAVREMCLRGGAIIGTPGIIFDFDLDGFIFLIAMKILFAVLRFLVYLITSLFFVVIAIIMAPFTFFPRMARLNGNVKNGLEEEDDL